MVSYSYIDDSKDRGANRVVVCAGFVAQLDRWSAFRRDWRRVCVDSGIEYYKSSECFSVNGQFKQFRTGPYADDKSRDHAQLIRGQLQEVVRQHVNLRGIGIAVDVPLYRHYQELPGAGDVLPVNPYKAALGSVMLQTVRYLKRIAKFPMVAFVHDDGDDFPEMYLSYQAFRKANKNTAKRLGGFTSADDKKTPELQLADMIANHTAHIAQQMPDLRREKLELKSNISDLGIWDESYLRNFLKYGLEKRGKSLPFDLDDGEMST